MKQKRPKPHIWQEWERDMETRKAEEGQPILGPNKLALWLIIAAFVINFAIIEWPEQGLLTAIGRALN